MRRHLFIVEGLLCSGKSTTSAFIARLLEKRGRVCFVDEGTGNHPADYEFHALSPAGLLSPESEIVPLGNYSGEMLERLLPYKIYDALPWEIERPLMLDKWKQFVHGVNAEETYVFNCVFLQNPMCETMMRFGFDEEESLRYIGQIAQVISPLNPVIIYLKNDDIAQSVRRASEERPGWLDAVIDYHISGRYAKHIGAKGFDGYIRCLEERQRRELRILEALPLEHLVLDNPQRDWPAAMKKLRAYLEGIE